MHEHPVVLLMVEHPADSPIDLLAVLTIARHVAGCQKGHDGERRARGRLAEGLGLPRPGCCLCLREKVQPAYDRIVDRRIRRVVIGDGD
ncbi:MAG: hypothetical protein R3C02_17675 [Planctomycetaceae bacterium]